MRRKHRPGGGRQLEVTIETLGARGDGVVLLPGDDESAAEPLYLAQTLPGERVLARLGGPSPQGLRGEVIELLVPSPDRVEPPCPHFGPCGGCLLQHFAPAPYRAWKRGLLVEALRKRGFAEAEALVRPLLALPPGTRRRASFSALRQGRRVLLGFNRRFSHAVEDMSECHLLAPPLVAMLPALRQALAPLLPEGKPRDVVATLTESGIDLLLDLPVEPDLAAREALAALAAELDLARLSLAVAGAAPPPLAERRSPRITLGGVAVTPPPGGFLQPTAEGEAALTALVLEAVPGDADTVADLYSGCGTFSFPLAARGHRVHAVEGAAEPLAALQRAARQGEMAQRITAEQRDLERDPVTADELEGGDAAVFDPPRAGAKAQAAELAASDLPVVVAVSCNPGTFARDARALVEGGFTLDWAAPVDQFPWSGHLELVARFSR